MLSDSVQHWRFDKNELFAVADIQRVASFHYIKNSTPDDGDDHLSSR